MLLSRHRLRKQQEQEAAALAASEAVDADEDELMAQLNNQRRYFRLKAEVADDETLGSAWRGKLAALTPGTPLPDVDGGPFPHTAELAAHNPPYLYLEDLDGADEVELVKVKGVGKAGAAKILAALPSE